jgi:hypothetical protein
MSNGDCAPTPSPDGQLKLVEAALVERWASAMTAPQVRGLVVGRTRLYPPDGDVAAAVGAAAGVLLKRRVAA